jgi:hypothetical protein
MPSKLCPISPAKRLQSLVTSASFWLAAGRDGACRSERSERRTTRPAIRNVNNHADLSTVVDSMAPKGIASASAFMPSYNKNHRHRITRLHRHRTTLCLVSSHYRGLAMREVRFIHQREPFAVVIEAGAFVRGFDCDSPAQALAIARQTCGSVQMLREVR